MKDQVEALNDPKSTQLAQNPSAQYPRALTIRQPWASLIAMGVKTIETRSWKTDYRGPLAIHAGKYRPKSFWSHHGTPESSADPLLAAMSDQYRFNPLFDGWESSDGDGYWRHEWCGPLGAIVATCQLVNVLPIRDSMDSDASGDYIIVGPNVGVGFVGDRDFGMLDQVPYGDFTPGRFAWMLANVRRVEPIPMTGKQGLWKVAA